MCGIGGIVAISSGPPTRAELESMCTAMVHRGPDDSGLLLDGTVGLAVRRLSVIDVAGGHQPIFNEDETVAVVFNGEIYNFRELRRMLEGRGHRFRTASDTEVIAHLWEEFGIDFAGHLHGMFAVALFDRVQRRVVLARDHVGVKPLYYALDAGVLVFGSEVKVVLASGRVRRTLDVDAVGQFLAWEYVPGERTMLKEVRRLEPARTLECDLNTGTVTVRRFWDVLAAPDPAGARTEADWEDELDALVAECVRSQLVSDVPLGTFLSGGVDSSLVASATNGAQAFSIGFEDPSYDETEWSRRVARHLGMPHRVEILRPQALDLFDRVMHHNDDPIGDFSIFPTYLVSQVASRHVKVVLLGDGGDELFGGYDTYLANERSRSWQRWPASLRHRVVEPLIAALPPTPAKKGFINKAKRFVEGARLDPALGHARWRIFCDEVVRSRLFTGAAQRLLATPADAHILALKARAQDRDDRDQALYVDFSSYLVDNCLAKVDRMSMACSIEARVPLLDRRLVEFAFRLPSSLKFDDRRTKILLKRVAARHVPRECVYRPKEGFSIPIKQWLRGELRGLVEHYLAPARLRQAGLFQPLVVEDLWREHLANRANNSHLLWSLLVFEQWRERWSVAL